MDKINLTWRTHTPPAPAAKPPRTTTATTKTQQQQQHEQLVLTTYAVEHPDLSVRRGPRHAVPVVVDQRAVVPGHAPQVGAQLPNVVHGGVVGPPVLGPVVAVRSEVVRIGFGSGHELRLVGHC